MVQLVLLMVFFSVAGICFLLCRTLFTDLEYNAAERTGGWDGRSQIEYFISLPKLRKIRICFAVVGALVFLCLLLVAGVPPWSMPPVAGIVGDYFPTGNIPAFVEKLRQRGDLRLDMSVFVPRV